MKNSNVNSNVFHNSEYEFCFNVEEIINNTINVL